MGWTTPKTWSVGELVTANLLNEQLKDNLTYLKVALPQVVTPDTASQLFTTSTSFVDVDSVFTHILDNVQSGTVMAYFHGTFTSESGALSNVSLNVSVDGVDVATENGILGAFANAAGTSTGPTAMTFTHVITGLSAGSHTFRLRWRTNNGRINLLSHNYRNQFWVRELR